jgi:hypothetical protein
MEIDIPFFVGFIYADFLFMNFSVVQGTFGVMCPCPSVDLRLAVCMSELMSATSNTPSRCAVLTRSPLFGIGAVLSVI